MAKIESIRDSNRYCQFLSKRLFKLYILFNIVIDWVLRRATKSKPRSIRWTLFPILEALDIADDLALLSHTHCHIQEKDNKAQHFQPTNCPKH